MTVSELSKIMPLALTSRVKLFAPELEKTMQRYEINTRLRKAAFIAQLAHETGALAHFIENTNYSATRLAAVWPNRFKDKLTGLPNKLALSLHRNPEMIANNVYANRMGNGSVASGDGWKYRGKGAFHCTGREMYQLLSKEFGVDFVANPELLEKPEWAALSAGWFWNLKKLNTLADQGRFELITRRVNGGLNGQKERLDYYNRALKVLST